MGSWESGSAGGFVFLEVVVEIFFSGFVVVVRVLRFYFLEFG